MKIVATFGGGFKPLVAAPVWRADPLPPTYPGSYRRAWLEARGFSAELAAVVAELAFNPMERRT